jgi:hypothetical protein
VHYAEGGASEPSGRRKLMWPALFKPRLPATAGSVKTAPTGLTPSWPSLPIIPSDANIKTTRGGPADRGFNVRASHWLVCLRHGFRWRIGANLSSYWKNEPESLHKANAEFLRCNGSRSSPPMYSR